MLLSVELSFSLRSGYGIGLCLRSGLETHCARPQSHKDTP